MEGFRRASHIYRSYIAIRILLLHDAIYISLSIKCVYNNSTHIVHIMLLQSAYYVLHVYTLYGILHMVCHTIGIVDAFKSIDTFCTIIKKKLKKGRTKGSPWWSG